MNPNFTLAEQLALDELLLHHVNEKPGRSSIRFYDSEILTIVLGLGNKVAEHVHIDACEKDKVSILRRCSGGGSIIQGKGCLSYALFLRYEDYPDCADLKNTTQNLLEHLCKAFQNHGIAAHMKGISDVAIGNKKIIGNAQRRLKNACLFHGCILYDFDINCIAKYLKAPPTAPAYRQNRKHQDFVQNIKISKEKLQTLILSAWPHQEARLPIQMNAIQALCREKYQKRAWSFRV